MDSWCLFYAAEPPRSAVFHYSWWSNWVSAVCPHSVSLQSCRYYVCSWGCWRDGANSYRFSGEITQFAVRSCERDCLQEVFRIIKLSSYIFQVSNRLSITHFLLNLIRMADMLSMPYYEAALSFANRSSSSSSITLLTWPLRSSSLAFTQAVICALVLTYQMPSHPIIIKSIASFFIFIMSGFAVIICYSGVNVLLPLYSKSPMARVRLRLPFTLPNDIYPPAFLMRFISIWSSGLWSLLNSFVSPLSVRHTDLESPAFAQ